MWVLGQIVIRAVEIEKELAQVVNIVNVEEKFQINYCFLFRPSNFRSRTLSRPTLEIVMQWVKYRSLSFARYNNSFIRLGLRYLTCVYLVVGNRLRLDAEVVGVIRFSGGCQKSRSGDSKGMRRWQCGFVVYLLHVGKLFIMNYGNFRIIQSKYRGGHNSQACGRVHRKQRWYSYFPFLRSF
jgi:hypothetical protein